MSAAQSQTPSPRADNYLTGDVPKKRACGTRGATRAPVAVMDRFAFLSAQPWLFPPPARSVRPRRTRRGGRLGDRGGGRRPEATSSTSRASSRSRRRAVDPPREAASRTTPQRGPRGSVRRARQRSSSERERVRLPTRGNTASGRKRLGRGEERDCGHPSSREAWETPCPVVGAAAADAVHMAFAPHDEWPDQAQFACSIRVRRAVVERDCPEGTFSQIEVGPRATRPPTSDRDASADENDVSSATCWLEMTVDGATHAREDISQSRHVVVGPPADREQTRVDSPDAPEPHPTESRAPSGASAGR